MREQRQGNAGTGLAHGALSRSRAILLLGALAAVAGCSKTAGSFDTDDSGQTKMNNLWALVQFKPIPTQPQPFAPVKCPEIGVQDGTAEDRIYGPRRRQIERQRALPVLDHQFRPRLPGSRQTISNENRHRRPGSARPVGDARHL